MALRDRQINGIPLTKGYSALVALACTALVPVLGYQFWYPFLGIPKELWLMCAVVGIAVHLSMSVGLVPENRERAQLFNGAYTGVSFPAGIYLIPRVPLPVILFAVKLLCSEEVYRKILWAMEGDARVESILAKFQAEGLTQDGLRVRIGGFLRLELMNVGTFLSQTREGSDVEALKTMIIAEYAAAVKTSVITQHTAEELIRGTHSGGSSVLNEWMTDAWKLVKNYGVELASSPVSEVAILSKRMEGVFDAVLGKELLRTNTQEVAEAFAQFKATLPAGTSDEVAMMMFNAARIDEGQPAVSINTVKFK